MSAGQASAAHPTASIVVVSWQSAKELARLVGSMNRLLSGDEELIVVDNDSTDNPLEAARSWKGDGLFIAMDRNCGYGIAANAGVAEAASEAVAILNPDTELLDDGLPGLAKRSVGRNGLLGPRIVGPQGDLQPSASGPPVGAWPWIYALTPSPLGPRWLKARTAPWRLDSDVEVSWLTGCVIAGPRSILRELGPFDPAIDLYGEDLDLGLRAGRLGYRSYFAPELCTVVHYGKASSAQRFDDFGRGLVASHEREILDRHFGGRAEMRARRAKALGLQLRVGAKGLLRRPNDWDALELRSLRDGDPGPALAPGYESAVPKERIRIGG